MEKQQIINLVNQILDSIDVEKIAEKFADKKIKINQKSKFYKFKCNFIWGHYFEKRGNLKVCKRCGKEIIDQ
jgi:hypothetical protein